MRKETRYMLAVDKMYEITDKLYRGKKILFLAIILSFLVGSNGAFAITFDLQPYTKCNGDFCYTALDVSTLGINTAKINALKSANITQFLNKVGVGFKSINYEWKGNILNVSGYINKDSNNYWDFTIGGDTYHPWWNYTVTNYDWSALYNWDNPDNLGGGAVDNTNHFGIVIRTASNLTTTKGMVLDAVRFKSDPYKIVSIYDQTGLISLYNNTSSFTEGGQTWANFTNAYLNASTNYTIVAVCCGTRTYFLTPAYPYEAGKGFNVTAGMSATPPLDYAHGNTLIFEFDKIAWRENISTATEYSIYYTTNLWLNGTSGDYNITNTSIVNITATTNLTDMNITLLRNGSIIGSALSTSIMNYTYFPNGLWNITAFFYNSSTNTSISYWLNSVYIAPIVRGYIYCSDNSTLAHINITNLQTDNTITYYESCMYNCDNVTQSCMPPPVYQNIYIIIIIGIFLLIIYWVSR